ncbi:MAG: cobaltochelatase subunit CobN, partial [Cyanobacteria bacterium P01_A01_bin.105]
PLPHFYPFIVNDPGEGSQAKRRAQAVIVDHLTPPLTRAELYGPLQQLESLVDEYYDAQTMDPNRVPVIAEKIEAVLGTSHLGDEIGLTPAPADRLETVLPTLDGYLCELKEAQIRDGLHILGQCPQGRQLRDLVVAIARHPNGQHIGLSRAIAQNWGLTDLDPLTDDLATPFEGSPGADHLAHCRTVGDVVDAIEQQAAAWVEQRLSPGGALAQGDLGRETQPVLDWIDQTLLPALAQTSQEIEHLLRGLDGRYIPPGPSGAPTRNRPEVLPTGRNFYSIDIRAMPTESAWDLGRRAADVFIETYTQDHGEYPQTLGLSMWGTAAMRTGGDDLAEALALLGVQPVWDGPSRRVVDFEILPLSVLGRPRVDVTLRVSGFFRDAFANLIDLFDQAVAAVARLPEPEDQNPLAARFCAETADWQRQGLTADQADRRASYRVFGSKPGAYGAGLQGLIEAQNWTSDDDLARAYMNWSSYAYGRDGVGQSAPEAFQQRLGQMQVVLHNQDNREHDLLDSDDYYQFQGGLTAAVKAASGQRPQTYFGDHSVVERPRVRTLQAEIARVYRARVVNPKWIAGVMRHGYKGAFEMAATVDYLFAYDATTGAAADYMYEGVAAAYVLDPAVQQFVQHTNPWALRDMAERLLEAQQRGLWQTADSTCLESLRSVLLQAERAVEEGT